MSATKLLSSPAGSSSGLTTTHRRWADCNGGTLSGTPPVNLLAPSSR
ncbi:hypothetical protein F441_09166 [Phytophthora nicotianae CJ01A1]|uniref:Uncharacterized protein n=5 Tax=Phytophthora nicotianae TaxID=4792 RepID=V9F4I2_PHYNI|nr:hypothetical protein F443_09211 [Phytophthora nicotianae P1569]ETK86331.1 hypothetical protein L915_09033 [Phytophthora nicotianae]ETO75056.1 hypothetical protein F444_09290 [Phytophthora nicotianae P1976]ETP16207.1 hypothetical protein F441_09166 [Phytophthora nicotianae CJ01A1]ETP44259.1 hypothetical protein F442_09133 [Phytophthora nicotianae P10297]